MPQTGVRATTAKLQIQARYVCVLHRLACVQPGVFSERSCLVQTPRFAALLADIAACIALLGGQVVPRLNWSCPTDAAWISATQSIACSSAEEVRHTWISKLLH